MVEFLINEYNFEKAEVKEVMQESFQGFALAKPEQLRTIADFLMNGKIKNQVVFDWEGENFTKAEMKEVMQKSFFGFALAKPEQLQAVVEFLINEYNFTKSEVKKLMQEKLSRLCLG